MTKNAKNKNANQYEAGTLAFFAVVGILLMTLGVLSLLAVMGGLQGAIFAQVKTIMQGLGGSLCFGVSILLIWGGLLMAFASGRGVPKRGILLMTLFYLAVLAIVNLLSKLGEQALIPAAIECNKNANQPTANADSFINVLQTVFSICGAKGGGGGALGMLLAWPAWTFLGTAIGTAVLVIICLLCVLFFSRFDVLSLFGSVRERAEQHKAQKQSERAQSDYQQRLEEQQQQAQENERRLLTPAFSRRGKTGEEAPSPPMPPAYPPFGSMLAQPPMPMQPNGYGYPNQNGFAPNPMQTAQPIGAQAKQPGAEMYDEIIIPQGKQLPWHRSETKKKKEKGTVTNAYQTGMTFTPSEMGVTENSDDELKREAIILSSSKKKALEHIESIRKRKAELGLENTEEAYTAACTSVPPTEAEIVSAPAQQPAMVDRTAAYRRPVESQKESLPAKPPQPAPMLAAKSAVEKKPYVYPSIDLLSMQKRVVADTRAVDAENATKLEKTLESFGIPARVQRVTHGPAVTRFELGLVSSGVNVKRIMSIADNIALDMAANGGVRIEIPIPGTNLFGIEVPNKEIQSVCLAEVLLSPEMQAAKSPLAVALGRDIAGKPIICDIAKMPHLLIAGQTGSGKSVCINAIINSILFRSSPDEVRMIMIDPKVVELQCYNVVPHLLIPVVSDPHKAAGALAWAVAEMLDRYHKMQSKNVRELSAYNAKATAEEKMPRIVIVIDELADLMLACKKEVEESIIRLAQLARAAGIHMIVATQRPTVDVITGLIKANVPSRIAFAVSSSIDSRTILDQNGAEKLLGRGDMFYAPTGSNTPIRVQGCFLSDSETERVVDYIGQHSHVDFDPNVIEAMEADDETLNPLEDDGADSEIDERLVEAIEMVIADGQASISMLQRRMKIGYARAGRLIDDMASRGIVSKSVGSKPREILISQEEFERIKTAL
ncbi:MAG: DNA translocase FtsK [Clostridia bacterium]